MSTGLGVGSAAAVATSPTHDRAAQVDRRIHARACIGLHHTPGPGRFIPAGAANLVHPPTSHYTLGAMANSSARAPIDVGSVIAGTYKIEALLGRGGMGSVFLASHQRLAGKQVAIKILHTEI